MNIDNFKSGLNEYLAPYYDEMGRLDLKKVCDANSVKLLEGDFNDKNISGALIHADNGWSIVVNKDHPTNRKRFTTAHELGHYFAYHNRSKETVDAIDSSNGTMQDHVIYRSDQPSQHPAAERLANQLAAIMLMPEASIKAHFNFGFTLEEMAEFFGVSESAMAIRLEELSLSPLELIR